MIKVNNTLEFERLYDINRLNDNEQVMILGGLSKSKYGDKPQYQKRYTYTVRELKEILQRIHTVESKINPNWNKKQIALYIYSTLEKGLTYDGGKFDGVSNSMRAILTGRAICSGYSLIFKEFMDRQGIQCDYVRGFYKAIPSEKHAWNVLTFDNEHYLVDLTIGEDNYHTTGQQFTAFGCNPYFHEYTREDDEFDYTFTPLSIGQINEMLNARDYVQNVTHVNTAEKRKQIIDYAINNTIMKYRRVLKKREISPEIALSLSDYIESGNLARFTNDGGARDIIIENQITQEDVLESVIDTYVQNILSGSIHIPAFIEGRVCSYEMNYKTHSLAKQQGRVATVQALKQFVLSQGRDNVMGLMTNRNDVLYIVTMEKALHIEEQIARRKNNDVNR